MKKLSIILCVIISTSFGKIQNQDIKIEVFKVDSSNHDNIKVTLKLKNNTSRNIEYIGMSCSNDFLFLTDNPNVEIIGKPCDKNIPVLHTIESNNSVKMKINLKCKTLEKTNFSIGFKLSEMPEKIIMRSDHTSTVKPITIWTEKIDL